MEPDPLRGAHPSEPAEGGPDVGDTPSAQGGPDVGDAPNAEVTPDNLRELLSAGDPAQLVLREGRLGIESGDGEPGLVVITRGALAERLGERADDDTALAEQAAELSSEIRQLGG